MLWSSLSAQVLNDYQDFHWESFLIASSVPFSQLVIKTTCQALEKTLVQECWTDVGLHLKWVCIQLYMGMKLSSAGLTDKNIHLS